RKPAFSGGTNSISDPCHHSVARALRVHRQTACNRHQVRLRLRRTPARPFLDGHHLREHLSRCCLSAMVRTNANGPSPTDDLWLGRDGRGVSVLLVSSLKRPASSVIRRHLDRSSVAF